VFTAGLRTEHFNVIQVNIRIEVLKTSVHVLQEATCYTDHILLETELVSQLERPCCARKYSF